MSQFVARTWRSLFSGKYLWCTNTLGTGVMFGCGDALLQLSFAVRHPAGGPSPRWDPKRTVKMFCVGLMMGPLNHHWYAFLDKLYPIKTPANVLKMIAADETVASPVFGVSFYLVAGSLESKTVGACLREFLDKFPRTYVMDLCVWPPTQYLNFLFAPRRYRVTVVNVATVAWTGFLSYVKHDDDDDDGDDDRSRGLGRRGESSYPRLMGLRGW